ncbi:MAG: DUF1656 domain-containing protein [Nitrospirae bacterium]|nr:DUF1656 domain-containing protein [Nitrospirota bacterium]MCL5285094.1 DUF1656 domain-containing protein [Nitrospirota bacterium]
MKEVDLFGVFLSPFLLWGTLAFFTLLLVRALLDRSGFYAHVWHRPLFDLSLYLLIFAILVSIAWSLSE